MLKVIEDIKPDEILNFAAQSHVKHSFDTPLSTFTTNTLGVWNICESVRLLGLQKVKILHASTSEMFGPNHKDSAAGINEQSKMEPCSPYAVSKMRSYHICKYYRSTYKINIV